MSLYVAYKPIYENEIVKDVFAKFGKRKDPLQAMLPFQQADPLLSIGMVGAQNAPILNNLRAAGNVIDADYIKAFNMLAARSQQIVADETRKEEAADAELSARLLDLTGGAKVKKTDKCVVVKGRKRVIYLGSNNKRFVKVLGKFVTLSSLK